LEEENSPPRLELREKSAITTTIGGSSSMDNHFGVD